MSHLKRKTENAKGSILELAGEPGANRESNAILQLAEPVVADLEKSQWSVISFNKLEAGGLTYAQAAALTAELDSCGISGLCVVTDAAAARIG